MARGLDRRIRAFAALALAVLLAGCVSDEAASVHSVWRPADAQPSKLSVFYVTDREADPHAPGGFGKYWSDKASCGVARALIPPANLPGEPAADAQIIAGRLIACAADKDSMAGIVAAIKDEARRKNCHAVLLYIHGFNTAFYSALARAGQLSLDTESGCVAAAFSWSSEGNVDRYISDIEHDSYSEPYLEAFLRALAASHLRIDIVSHSMGCRLALATLSSFAKRDDPPRGDFIDQFILAAADVGAAKSNDDFLHLLNDAVPFARRTTIYASTEDAVLVVSKRAHGNVVRAGGIPNSDRRYQMSGAHLVDLIDASEAPGDILGHSYYGLSYEAVSDIALTLRDVPAADRLAPGNGWPATLICEKGATCDGADPVYALKVADSRKPGWSARLIRSLVPFIPSF